MRVAIFNNYRNLYDTPAPKGIRNIIGYPDNIGNMVFLESIAREVGADSIDTYDFTENYRSYEGRYDMIILSLANMVSSTFDLDEEFLTALENTKIPICIFSIGIQAYNLDELLTMELSPDVVRILNIANKSGTTIGLRGEITKEYLDRKGITNTQVIGCPSLFYDKKIPVKKDSVPNDILLSGTFNGNWRTPLYDIYKFGYEHCKSYLIQNESRILFDKYQISESELTSWNLPQDRISYLMNKGYDYSYYCHPSLNKDDLAKWLIDKSVYYNDFDEWLNSMRGYDMHVGARFHGSVMTTLAEVPTLILCGDLRVKEFVDYHKMPNIDIFGFRDEMKPKEIYGMIDYAEYESAYDGLKDNYINYLRKNGLQFTSR